MSHYSPLLLLGLTMLAGSLMTGCDGDAQAKDKQPRPFAEFRGDSDVANTAVREWAGKGEAALPELRKGLSSDSIKVRHYCQKALSMITGQWGGDGRLMWQRSVKDAKGGDKPLMVLHLFGKFDDEFC